MKTGENLKTLTGGEEGDRTTSANDEEMAIITSMTDEVGYRHWTFYNDDIEYVAPVSLAPPHLHLMRVRRTILTLRYCTKH